MPVSTTLSNACLFSQELAFAPGELGCVWASDAKGVPNTLSNGGLILSIFTPLTHPAKVQVPIQ